jgi:hypothetical protein
MTNVYSSIVTPQWIVDTYSRKNWVEVFYREAKGWLGDSTNIKFEITAVYCTILSWFSMPTLLFFAISGLED